MLVLDEADEMLNKVMVAQQTKNAEIVRSFATNSHILSYRR
jgi:hypothetical protein